MDSLEIRQLGFENDLKLLEAGINLGRSENLGIKAVKSDKIVLVKEHVTVNIVWWGIDIIFDEELTKEIIKGTEIFEELAEVIAELLGIFTEGIALLIGKAFALAIKLKVLEIKIADRDGMGVHFPNSWLQIAPVISQIPLGPVAMLEAIMVFIHPAKNKI